MRKFLTLTAAAAFAVAFGFTGTASAQVTFPFDDSLVGYWSFDDGADPTNDDSANSNSGALETGGGSDPTFDSGELAPIFSNVNSLEFPGPPGSGFVEVDVAGEATFDFERTDSFTLAAWVKLSAGEIPGPADGFILSKNADSGGFEGYLLLVCGGTTCPQGHILGSVQNVAGGFNVAATGGDTDIADDSFHHVAMVWDGSCKVTPDVSCMSLFVDGASEALTTASDTLGTVSILNNVPLTIGSRDTGGVPYTGNIDDARVYNRALTADEILQLATGISIEKELVSTDEVTGGNTNADNVLQQGEEWEFTMKVTVTNNSSEDFSDVVIRDPLPGDLEIGDGTSDTTSACLKDETPLTPSDNTNLDPTVGSVATKDKGRTDKCILDWTIGDFDSGDSEMLTIIASTDKNPGKNRRFPVGHQEFTSPGPYCINQGAKFTGERDSDDAIIIIRSNGLLVPDLATLAGDQLQHDVVSHDDCDPGS